MYFRLFCLFLFGTFSTLSAQQTHPNLLLIIADDLGVDRVNGYHDGTLMATTPTLDSLRAAGITFTNAYAAPMCSPSRAAMMSGKYGVNNGVPGVPGNLDLDQISIFKELATVTDGAYADAVVGKWHIAQPSYADHPIDHGADYYMGLLGNTDNYFEWDRTENGSTSVSTEYVTTALTDASIDWVNEQTDPWFLWLAHPAPHGPFHVPPAGLYTIANTDNTTRQYIAMVESVDHEINRLLNGMIDSVRENTLIVFVGDNGTPAQVLQDYPTRRGKGTLYQGGVRVPFIVAGKGVERQGVREDALVHLADIYATFLDVAGADLPGGIYNSQSFAHLLNAESMEATRDYNYTEIGSGNAPGWAIRSDRYKLINWDDGTQAFYDVVVDSFELMDLLAMPLTDQEADVKADLEAEAIAIRTGWSCRDYIQNGTETGIDCGTTDCGNCTTGVFDLLPTVQLTAYPNPGQLFFFVETDDLEILEVRVLDASGRVVQQFSAGQTERVRINSSNWAAGVYLLETRTAEGVGTVRVVKGK